MAVETLSTTRPLRTLRIGVALAVVLALADIVGMLAFGLSAAPAAIIVLTLVIAVATLVGAVGAWRNATWRIWVVTISRVLSALGILPIFFAPEGPKEAIPMGVVVVVLDIVCIVLMFIGRAKRR